MNPCPCGWAGDPSGCCLYHPDAILRYRGCISGPLLERIDLHLEVPRPPPAELRPDAPPGESSDVGGANDLRRAPSANRAAMGPVDPSPHSTKRARLCGTDALETTSPGQG
jgi:magnesium chelatase family protein